MADLTGRNADETVPDIATWGTGNVLETGEGTVKVDLDNKASLSGAITATLERGSNQSIPNDEITVINFSTAIEDTGGFWSSSNNSRLTIPSDGLYLVVGQFRFQTISIADEVRIQILLNGSDTLSGQNQKTVDGTSTRLGISYVSRFSEGDYLELQAAQNSGDTQQILTGSPVPIRFVIVRLFG